MPLLRPRGYASFGHTAPHPTITTLRAPRLLPVLPCTRAPAKRSLTSKQSSSRHKHTSTPGVRAGISDMVMSGGQDGRVVPVEETQASTERGDLTSLSATELIARIAELEARLKSTTAKLVELTSNGASTTNIVVEKETSAKPVKVRKSAKPFDFSRYSTRHIALKFAYLGHRYNGLEHTNGSVTPPRPTIEEALWKALRKARLIPPGVAEGCDGSFEVVFGEVARKRLYASENVRLEIDWTGLDYSKCGRTDKGVSAFGQVVGVKVRSNRPKDVQTQADLGQLGCETESEGESVQFDDVKNELPYVSVLNSVLPSDIRILAWCPNVGDSFDARFGCKERQYKYFFTNPAFCPLPGPVGFTRANGQKAGIREGWLDIEAMQKAARKLEGLHDFRNFCKLDASKQMSSCERRITYANIEEMPGGVDLSQFTTNLTLNQHESSMGSFNDALDPQGPKVYAFAVHGTAFLWHQVRCMVAILFLVGQGLEQPEIVDELLDIVQNPAKPQYEMADDAPLVLWNCVFPGDEPGDEGGMKWLYAGDEASVTALVKKGDSPSDGKFGTGGLVSDVWVTWREAKMKEVLTAGLLSLTLGQGDGTSLQRGGFRTGVDLTSRSQRVFAGSDFARNVGKYLPIMQKEKLETLEVQNTKYLNGKQARRDLKKIQLADGDRQI